MFSYEEATSRSHDLNDTAAEMIVTEHVQLSTGMRTAQDVSLL